MHRSRSLGFIVCCWMVCAGCGPSGTEPNPGTGALDGGAGGEAASGGEGGAGGSAAAGGAGGEGGAGGAEPVPCGPVYYVDAELGDDAWSGTLPAPNAAATDGPWKTVGKVNGTSFEAGDDVHFKVGTTLTPRGDAHGLRIDWSGSADNPVVVGAYYDEGGTAMCGLGGHPRPVFDFEDWTYPTGEWASGISFNSASYVEIRDLHVLRASRSGIVGTNSAYITIGNNYIDASGGSGIALMRSHDSLIVDNTSEKAGGQVAGCQGAIIAGGNDQAGSAYDVVIRGNTVFHSRCEGIGLYKTGQHLIVEHNVVYDCENVNIYLDAVKNCTVRYNLSFSTAEGMPGSGTPRTSWGISTEMEQQRCDQYPQTYPGDWNSGHAVYGNLIAGVRSGIRIASLCGSSVDNKYYNNTIVSSEHGFALPNAEPGDGWSGNEIRNNLLVTFVPTDSHSTRYDRVGVTWSNNLFYGGDADAVHGTDAASGAVFGDPLLSKTTGWKEIDAAEVVTAWWEHGPQSPAVDQGATLDPAYATDVVGVSRPQGAAWDIGAFEK